MMTFGKAARTIAPIIRETLRDLIECKWVEFDLAPEWDKWLATRRGKTDKVRFMNIAESSLEESHYYLILAPDLGYGQTDYLSNSAEEVRCLLNAYARAILTSGFRIPLFCSGISRAKPLPGRDRRHG